MLRKGITPVIAIVLLLLITVGAVGVVYSQFQNLADTNPSEQVARQQKIQNTELTYDSVYKDTSDASGDETINITLRNTGSEGVNVSKQFELQVIPEGSDSSVGYDTFEKVRSSQVRSGEKTCFEVGNGMILDPSETYTCDTGILFPSPGDTVGLVTTFKGADKSFDYSCSPSTSGSFTC